MVPRDALALAPIHLQPLTKPSFHRKIPWRLSSPRKYRQRQRLKRVDRIVATLDTALAKKRETTKQIERWKFEMPTEAEMLPRDKYTMFDRKVRGYRKGIHSELLPLEAVGEGGFVLTGDRATEVDEG